MGTGTELVTEVVGEGPHVGALGATDVEVDFWALPGEQFEFGDADCARLAHNLDALASEVVELLPADFFPQVHWRDLGLVA